MTQKEFQSKIDAICSCMEQIGPESREQMIERLYQEYVEARKDTKMLDWYNNHHESFMFCPGRGWQKWVGKVAGLHRGRWEFQGETLRQAITLAMEKGSQ